MFPRPPSVCFGHSFGLMRQCLSALSRSERLGFTAPATNVGVHASSQGTLTMMGSTVDVQGPLFVGTGIGATGAV